jgi:uncharacterized membrane protein YkoI
MRRTATAIAAGAAVLAIAVPALAAKRGHDSAATTSTASRLDDGKSLLPKARISEQDAIAAARSAASGALNEVDLEYRDGTLVFNVDVGARDVKVDAASGDVVAIDQDD